MELQLWHLVLQNPIKLDIGAKCTREQSPTYLIASSAQVLTLVGTYYQLKDNYNNVAMWLTSLGILAVMVAIRSPSILLLQKILVYNVLWCFRLGPQQLLHLYLQFKIWCFRLMLQQLLRLYLQFKIWCFPLGSQRLLHLCLELKLWNCHLAICDEFKPMLHRANAERELMTLHNCSNICINYALESKCHVD